MALRAAIRHSAGQRSLFIRAMAAAVALGVPREILPAAEARGWVAPVAMRPHQRRAQQGQMAASLAVITVVRPLRNRASVDQAVAAAITQRAASAGQVYWAHLAAVPVAVNLPRLPMRTVARVAYLAS